MMNPPIMTLSPVSMKPRVLMLASWSRPLVEFIGFHQPDAGGAVCSPHDRGVGAGNKGLQNGRLRVVGRLEAGRFNLGLLTFFPVVVA